MEQKTINLFLEIIKAVINGTKLSESCISQLDDITLKQLYALAQKHDLAHFITFALNNCNTNYDNVLSGKGKIIIAGAIYRYEQKQYCLNRIYEIFEKNGIDFVPLKGAIIAQYYPEPWMRTSCDIDILVKKEQISKAIQLLEKNEWALKEKTVYNDYSLYYKDLVHLELHFNIRETFASLDKVLDTVWDSVEVSDGFTHKFRQNNEFILFHLLAHMSYHFLGGGCGVRSFIDIWLLLKKVEYDKNKLYQLCKLANIDKFCDSVFKLINVWFGEEEYTQTIKDMEKYVLMGGTYGENNQRIAVQQIKTGGKLQNVLNRIFMPYETLNIKYPSLKNRKYLTPVYQIIRLIDAIRDRRIKTTVRELRINSELSDETIGQISKLLAEVGLDKLK